MKVTGVGSREAPDHIGQLFKSFVYYTMTQGLSWASGSSGIMDESVEQGALLYFEQELRPKGWTEVDFDSRFRSYLPWARFGDRPTYRDAAGNPKLYYVAPSLANYRSAESMASKLHPVWDKLGQGARKMHSRNMYQVLDVDLDNPSDLIVYWAIPTKSGAVRGGTNMAVQASRLHNVPELNAHDPKVEAFLERYINEKLELTDLLAFVKLMNTKESTE